MILVPGTCEIRIQASGKFIEESSNSIRLTATPRDIRFAALKTIEACLMDHGEGGYSTHDFGRVVRWIEAPSTDFPENLNLGPDLTFFTAMIWNFNTMFPTSEPEPGSHDESTAYRLADQLRNTAKTAPAKSVLQRNLEARADWVESSAATIHRDYGPETEFAWWSGADEHQASSPNQNPTTACNATANLTLPGVASCISIPYGMRVTI